MFYNNNIVIVIQFTIFTIKPLVGGLEHFLFSISYIWDVILSNWLSYVLKGWLNHQPVAIEKDFF